jgi:hypothetical protein
MATLIPSLGSARFDSRGELRLAERLKDFLEENAYIWHNLPMGPRGAPGLRHRPPRQWLAGARGQRLAPRNHRVREQVRCGTPDIERHGSNRQPFRTSAELHVRRGADDPARRDAPASAGPRICGQVDRAVRVRRGVHQHYAQAVRADRPGRRLPRRPLRVQRRNDRERRCGSVPYPAVENGVAAIGGHLRPCPSSTDCAR